MSTKKEENVMETFPLWKLPGLARKLVFQQMNKRDLMDLSMTSRPVNKFLTAYKTQAIQLTWKFSHFDPRTRPNRFIKGITRPQRTYMTLTLTFRNKVVDEDEEYREYEVEENFHFYILENTKVEHDYDGVIEQDYARTINGVKAPLAMRKRENPKEFEIGGDSEEADLKFMEDLTQHFKSIFYIDAYNVTHESTDDFDFFESFIWKYGGKKFGKLHINPRWYVHFEDEQIRMIFNELEVDDLYLSVHTCSKSIPGLNLNSKKLTLKTSDFLSFEDVLESKCETMEITFPGTVNVEHHLLKTVTNWKTGEKLGSLKMMTLKSVFMTERNEEDKRAFFERAKSLGMRRHDYIGNIGYINRDTDKAVAMLAFTGRTFKMTVYENDDVVPRAREEFDDSEDDYVPF